MSTPGGEQLGEAHVEIDMDVDPAVRALQRFSRETDRRLRETRRRFEAEANQIRRSVTGIGETPVEIDTVAARRSLEQLHQSLRESEEGTSEFRLILRGLSESLSPLTGALGKVALGVGAIGAAAGSALPLLAGVVTALQNIAPAGAVAATGFLAVRQASAAVQLGMVGVGDAVTAAFDTSTEGTEKFQESLEKLAPSAREFAVTVRELAPAFTDFQQSIQQQLFTDFSAALSVLSQVVLPAVRLNLEDTATALNQMALSAAGAAIQLSTSGTLGQAMAGANDGLTNLSLLPAQVVTALGQLAAAGAPAFDRLTAAAADAATGISERLGAAFESGALTASVNTAIDVIAGLGDIAGNVFGILGNVLGAAATGGDGLFTVLTEITQALEDATATEGFQAAIGALVETMGVLADTAGPLIGQALAALGPVFVALAGPAQTLIAALGDALTPIIEALGPVLESAAGAVGALVVSLAPLLPVIGQLIADLLPSLVPLFGLLAQTFTDLAPIIGQVGQILTAVLAPVIAALPQILAPLIATFSDLFAAIAPLIFQLLDALMPAIISVNQSLSELLIALAPVLVMFANLATKVLVKLTPVIIPIIALLGRLASAFASLLAGVIRNVVVPAVNAIVSLFRGNFSGALSSARQAITGLVGNFRSSFNTIRTAVSDAIRTVIGILAGLGSRAVRALGNLRSLLYRSGRSLIQGFIDGIRSMLGEVRSAASSAASAARDFFGFSPAKEGPLSGRGWTLYSGQAFGTDFAEGIRDTQAAVRSATRQLVTAADVSSMLTSAQGSPAAAPLSSPSVSVATAAPRITVMIGNRVINEYVQTVVDRTNADAARQQVQGVRR